MDTRIESATLDTLSLWEFRELRLNQLLVINSFVQETMLLLHLQLEMDNFLTATPQQIHLYPKPAAAIVSLVRHLLKQLHSDSCEESHNRAYTCV